VVIGHCDACLHEDPERDFEYGLAILEQGAYCQFDMIGWTELADDGLRAQRLASSGDGVEKRLLSRPTPAGNRSCSGMGDAGMIPAESFFRLRVSE
jgi:predicted metal-dependent phosphotriesterase family hydrolase